MFKMSQGEDETRPNTSLKVQPPKEEKLTSFSSNINSSDPVWIMMEKAKKFDTEVSINMVISLPSKSLYNVAKESFENGGETVVEYIISNLDLEEIKNSLKIALKEAYSDGNQESEETKINQKLKDETNETKNAEDLIFDALGEPVPLEEPVVGDPIQEGDKIIEIE